VGVCTASGKTGNRQLADRCSRTHEIVVAAIVTATAGSEPPPLPPTSSRVSRLVAKLHPFPGMQHLDVAGGTGDVACRVQNAIDRACQDAAKHPHDPVLEVKPPHPASNSRLLSRDS